MTSRVYLGLGSNLQSPVTQVKSAIAELAEQPGIKLDKVSSLYRSKPLADMQQPDYINAVVEIRTDLDVEQLLKICQSLEDVHARDRTAERWGARTLDIDILLFGDQEINESHLTVPHKGMRERNFVLYPLAELDPKLKLPDNTNISDLVAHCSTEGLLRIE